MPTKSGIYYFYDKHSILLYVGKAKNFRERMRMHMNDNVTYSEYYEKISKVNEEILSQMSKEEFDAYSWSESLYGGSIQPIDQELKKVSRIEIREVEVAELDSIEKKLISEMKPPFNKESNSEEWNEIKNRFWEIRHMFVREMQRRNYF